LLLVDTLLLGRRAQHVNAEISINKEGLIYIPNVRLLLTMWAARPIRGHQPSNGVHHMSDWDKVSAAFDILEDLELFLCDLADRGDYQAKVLHERVMSVLNGEQPA
jgi:hypothetical protein